jgi:hypothetical protein
LAGGIAEMPHTLFVGHMGFKKRIFSTYHVYLENILLEIIHGKCLRFLGQTPPAIPIVIHINVLIGLTIIFTKP